jgi:hypothetical protein
MARAACLALVVVLGASPDISHLLRFGFQQGQPADPEKSAPQGTLPSPQVSSSTPASTKHGDRMSDDTRLAIIRAISGEFVRAQVPLPGGKDGLHVPASKPYVPPSAGKPVVSSVDSPHVYIAARPPAVHQGDHVQVTRLEFRDKQIVLDVNGGGKQKWHWRDHMTVGLGGGYPSSSMQQPSGPNQEGGGATIYLDFEHKLPEISPDEIKLRLAPILDFSHERSASAQYADTLPPEFQKAIKNRIAAVGMDREMVLAAMGRPDRKVRERDDDGNETEDWIFGTPPEKTVFVTFIGDKVVKVRQFPD